MSEPAASVLSSLIVLRVNIAQVTGDPVADTLREEFLTLYEQSRAAHAVIDMGAVTYLSSVGISPLLSLLHKVRERQGRLILCGLSRDVESVFLVSKLIESSHGVPPTFENHHDVPAAVHGLYQKP